MVLIINSLIPTFNKVAFEQKTKSVSEIFSLEWRAMFTYYCWFEREISTVTSVLFKDIDIVCIQNITSFGTIVYIETTRKTET
jgi:hypothetical protein